VIETFSGIGAQAKALERIKKRNPHFNYNIEATVEWEIGAMYAYDLIHHGPQDLSKYNFLSKADLIELLAQFNLSSDGKHAIEKSSLRRMNINQLKAIKHSIDNNKNLVDISSVHAKDLPDADLLTYSFPCQDLSISSFWHNNFSGIKKGVRNRSGLLWEIERILKEYEKINKIKPRFLLMENVSAIHGPIHNTNFKLWQKELLEMGYYSKYYDLNAKDFKIPQNRLRTFMISVYVKDLSIKQKEKVSNYLSKDISFQATSLNQHIPKIDSFLRLDYDNSKYFNEAKKSIPNYTPSRVKIQKDSQVLAEGNKCTEEIAKTITTKQDRNPNAGIIIHKLNLPVSKAPYRNLTPRETFLLMGFDEDDFQILVDNNLSVSKNRKFLSHEKLLKLSGNSIVVNILESVFKEILYMQDNILTKDFSE
jgi:DNA (cytosine-5)-methyltransferase 1